jgi:hypothetical protein
MVRAAMARAKADDVAKSLIPHMATIELKEGDLLDHEALLRLGIGRHAAFVGTDIE